MDDGYRHLILTEPELPAHLDDEDGFLRAALEVRTEVSPARFAGPLTCEAAAGPPWATLVAGLESDLFGMRQRFEAAALAGLDRDFLRRVLGTCYEGHFGTRASGPHRSGFEAWTRTLPEDLVAERPPTPEPTARESRLHKLGYREVGWCFETGHVPADHDPYLYGFADHAAPLRGAFFEQQLMCDPEDDDVLASHGTEIAYTLRCWLGSRRYAAPAMGCGDFVDSISILGFLNAILHKLGDSTRFVFADSDGEAVVVGPDAGIFEAIERAWFDDDEHDDSD